MKKAQGHNKEMVDTAQRSGAEAVQTHIVEDEM
jgi:hypothetical protein